MSTHRRKHQVVRRAFSVVEMLVAIAISGALLAASTVALDTCFKSYQVTTDSASSHVVSRIVMHRITSLIRTGTDFGPYPTNPLDPTQNPVISDSIEFVAENDGAGNMTVVRIEQVEDDTSTNGTDMLQLTIMPFVSGVAQTPIVQPILRGVQDATFILDYDVGPRLKKATVDITVEPNDYQDGSITSGLTANVIRFVASAYPKKIDLSN
ncbi:MAG: prepilin-type N-terminal cleavage/methylation domain-containing protein [Phycisphaeraceae bacterium]|nr:prepilin-type N-terminal cleavage/methylation domain-containing protein [Phycisphaerales bacterium]MCB9861228.1 prepilin-type N-terminal cleavage/methylation domain-containing protein [Phycisphaeraceae bacterium]